VAVCLPVACFHNCRHHWARRLILIVTILWRAASWDELGRRRMIYFTVTASHFNYLTADLLNRTVWWTTKYYCLYDVCTDAGGTLKIYGETICPEVPYKTLLLSMNDTATHVVRETLDKYGLEKENAHRYCLMQVTYTWCWLVVISCMQVCLSYAEVTVA